MFYARVIQVLITSPSDVPKSIIENVIESINDWNKINSESRRIMLKPVRWETDVYASLNNKEPQHIINTQIEIVTLQSDKKRQSTLLRTATHYIITRYATSNIYCSNSKIRKHRHLRHYRHPTIIRKTYTSGY